MSYFDIAKKFFLRNTSLPIYLIFFVTNKCNAKCNHCFYWQKTNSEETELTLNEIEKMSKTIGTLYHVNLTGGEPFLRNDLAEIAHIFFKNCSVKSIGIPTNGFDPEKICRISENIIKKCPQLNLQIDVSIDHFSEKHDQIRQFPGLFARAVQSIKMLKELNRKELTLGVILTLTKENEKEIEKIYYFIRDTLKPDLISPLLIRGQVRVPETKNIAYEQYKKLITLWAKDIKLHKLKGYHNSIIGSLVTARDIAIRRSILSGIQGNFIQGNCMAGILGAVIYENGEVFPCEILSDKIGNLRDYDYDFKKIWFSKKRADIVKKINREKCWCTHECFQGLNVVSNIKGMLSVFKELKCI